MTRHLTSICCLVAMAYLLFETSSCKPDEGTDPDPVDSIRLDSSAVSFKTDVHKVLMNGNCLGCHSKEVRQGSISLEGHDQMVKVAESGKLIPAIKHQNGVVPMPLDRKKLSEERIWVIERWVLQGLKDN